MQENGVNYYKGVLLCSRPNQSPSVQRPKPFCGRVFPKQNLGLVPTKRYDEIHVQQRKLPALSNHKKWLEGFKKKVQQQKKQQQEAIQKEREKIEKIKEQGRKQVEKIRNSGIASVPSQIKTKKNQKPLWAHTKAQIQAKQDEEVDDVLDFFEKGEVKDYLSDEQINKIMHDLKGRIQQIKKQGEDWREKQKNKIQQRRQNSPEDKSYEQDKKDDILSRISRQSGSQSVTSQKTAERVQQLEKKKKAKQWDQHTQTDKKSKVSIDEQIAKNVADQILRNYPSLKHHSNQSIRKLIQKRAHQEIKN